MRKIIHIDMDAFFAAVEMRDNPSLKNVPMAVGGSKDRRGVIATSNYEARKYGVKSAMPTALALKLCPHLVLVGGQMQKYKEASKIVFDIFHEYTNVVEGLSWDEAYLDVSDSPFFNNSATLIAQDIRKKIEQKTNGLTASAGISSNKLISKLASEIKKPNGQYTIHPNKISDFIKTIPIEKIWGIGKVTATSMHEMNINTCLDLQGYPRHELIYHFGKFGNALFDSCRGIDLREVEPEHERKSLGTEETFAKDIQNYEEMEEHIIRMVREVKNSLSQYKDKKIKNIHLKIKYTDFKMTTIERQIPYDEHNFLSLLKERWLQDPRPIRLLGVGVKFEDEKREGQLPLFDGLMALS